MTVAARLDLRLSARDKDRIAHAADLRGVSLSTFVRSAALHAACEAIADEDTITLSAKEVRDLCAALDKPVKPGSRLAQALRDHHAVKLDDAGSTEATGRALAARLRGRADRRMSTDEIMQLTRGA